MPKVTVDGLEIEIPQGVAIHRAYDRSGKENQNG
jgi:hypothetical protein